MKKFKNIFSKEANYKVVERCRLAAFNCGLLLVFIGTIELIFGVKLLSNMCLISVILTGGASMLAYIVGLIMLKINGNETYGSKKFRL